MMMPERTRPRARSDTHLWSTSHSIAPLEPLEEDFATRPRRKSTVAEKQQNRRRLSHQVLELEFDLLDALETRCDHTTVPIDTLLGYAEERPKTTKEQLLGRVKELNRDFRARWRYYSQYRRFLVCIGIVVLLLFIILLYMSFSLPTCNVLGCQSDFVYAHLRSRLMVDGEAVFNASAFPEYPQFTKVLTVSAGTIGQPLFKFLNTTEVDPLRRDSVHPDHLPPLSSDPGKMMPRNDRIKSLGPLVCGLLSPQTPILGMVPSTYTMTQDSQDIGIQISQHTNTSITHVNTTQSEGNFKREDLPVCCVDFFYDSLRKARVRPDDVEVRVACWASGFQGGMWAGWDSILAGYEKPSWMSDMRSGLQLDPSQRGGTVISLSSSQGDGWLDGLTISATATLPMNSLTVFDRLFRDFTAPRANLSFTTHVPFQIADNAADAATLSTDKMKVSLRLPGPDIDTSRMVPPPWLQRPGPCGNQLPMDVFVNDPYDSNITTVIAYAGQEFAFSASGCPKGYLTSGQVCWAKKTHFTVNHTTTVESTFIVNSRRPPLLYVTRVRPLMVRDLGPYRALRQFPVALIFTHASLNSTGLVNPRIRLLTDRNCPLPYEKSSTNLLKWEPVARKDDGTWRTIKLGRRDRLNITLEEGQAGISWTTSSRSGEIVIAIDADALDPQMPLSMKVFVPGCPEDICPPLKPIVLNPFRSEMPRTSWSWMEPDDAWQKVSRMSSAVSMWFFKTFKDIGGADLTRKFSDTTSVPEGSRPLTLGNVSIDATIVTEALIFSGPYNEQTPMEVEQVNSRVDSLDFFGLPIGRRDALPDADQQSPWPFQRDSRANDSAFFTYISAAAPLISKVRSQIENGELVRTVETVARRVQSAIIVNENEGDSVLPDVYFEAAHQLAPLAAQFFDAMEEEFDAATPAYYTLMFHWFRTGVLATVSPSMPMMMPQLQWYIRRTSSRQGLYQVSDDGQLQPVDVFPFLGSIMSLTQRNNMTLWKNGEAQTGEDVEAEVLSDEYILNQYYKSTESEENVVKVWDATQTDNFKKNETTQVCHDASNACVDLNTARDQMMHSLLTTTLGQTLHLLDHNTKPGRLPNEIRAPFIGQGLGVDISLVKKTVADFNHAKQRVRNAWVTEVLLQSASTMLYYGSRGMNVTEVWVDPVWRSCMIIVANLPFLSPKDQKIEMVTDAEMDLIWLLAQARLLNWAVRQRGTSAMSEDEIKMHTNAFVRAVLSVSEVHSAL